MLAALVVLSSGIVLISVVHLVVPRWRRRLLLLGTLSPVLPFLLTSRNFLAGVVATALLVPVMWLGREMVRLLVPRLTRRDAWLLGASAGIGVLGVTGDILARLGLLRAWLIWLLLLLAIVGLSWRAWRDLKADGEALSRWLAKPLVLPWLDVLLLGLGLGYGWLNWLSALAPETGPDASRARLPVAALYARFGRLAVDPEIPLSKAPGLGELVYATGLAIGPLQTAKLLNFTVWLLCVGLVFALGQRLGGARAGRLALVVFVTLPLANWLARTAYVDLWTTLFALAAALLVLCADALDWRCAGLIGFSLGLGIGVKLTVAPVAAGLLLALAIHLIWRCRSLRPVPWLVLAGVVTLAVAWLWIAPTLQATLHLADAVVTQSQSTGGDSVIQLGQFGRGRSLGAFLRGPFSGILESQYYGENQRGFLGYLLLGLVPLSLLRRRWSTAILFLACLVAYVAWFATVQYLRYALPFVAVLGTLGAAGFVVMHGKLKSRWAHDVSAVLLLVLAGLGVTGYLDTLLVTPGHAPYQVVLGLESKAAFLATYIPEYTALQLLNHEPGAIRAYSDSEPARLYSSVRVSSPFSTDTSLSFEGTDAQVWAKLTAGGYTHVVVDRTRLPGYWDEMTVISEEFLRRNATLVGGAHNVYLYRLLPPPLRGQEQAWARGNELLPNGDFEQTHRDVPDGWTAIGQPGYDASGAASRTGQAAVRATPSDGLITTVPVAPNQQYLMTHATRSAVDYSLARLQINWLDARGRLAGVSIEVVPASPRGYYLHSMLATSPATAVAATVYVVAQQGMVWFDDLSLRAVAPGGLAANPAAAAPITTRAPLALRAIHPATARVGEIVNPNREGAATLQVDGKNVTPGTVVLLDGLPLPTTRVNQYQLIAVLPPDLLVRPGDHRITLRNATGETLPLGFSVAP